MLKRNTGWRDILQMNATFNTLTYSFGYVLVDLTVARRDVRIAIEIELKFAFH